MKVSKIPGLGSYGLFIDDVDFATLSDEEWFEIGDLHLKSLVTILRNVKLSKLDYYKQMSKWGNPRYIATFNFIKKYKMSPYEATQKNIKIDEEDIKWLQYSKPIFETDDKGNMLQMAKITGKKNEKGEPIGMFAEGELLWHSNESGNLNFTPAVSLLGVSGVVGSATGFLTTSDWYEKQSEAFRSELDEMIILHRFTPGKINPGLRQEQDLLMYRNMCPEDDSRVPLVMRSPGGIAGLHFSVHTIHSVEGMSKKESDKFFDRLKKELFVDEYIYDHHYQQDNDLLLFDNSITLHRRLGGVTNRLCYRIQYDYDNLVFGNYKPYLQKEFNQQYNTLMRDYHITMGNTDKLSFKDKIFNKLGLLK